MHLSVDGEDIEGEGLHNIRGGLICVKGDQGIIG